VQHSAVMSANYAGLAVLVLAALGCVLKWVIVNPKAAISTDGLYCSARDLEHVDIGFQIDKHHRIVDVAPRSCLLKRFDDDRESVVSVLKDKHLVIVGDSLSRYAYLQLVYFLETGNFTSAEAPSQTWEKGYTSWNHFYEVHSNRAIYFQAQHIAQHSSLTTYLLLSRLQVTNKRLNGHETCDCYRAEAPKQAPLGKQKQGKVVKPIIIKQPPMIENRYYYNPDTQVRITYIQWFGRYT
jgi:hypothetical protein